MGIARVENELQRSYVAESVERQFGNVKVGYESLHEQNVGGRPDLQTFGS